MRKAWEDDPELKDRLAAAGWRYAQLIGLNSYKR
jgi:hypothetical protein